MRAGSRAGGRTVCWAGLCAGDRTECWAGFARPRSSCAGLAWRASFPNCFPVPFRFCSYARTPVRGYSRADGSDSLARMPTSGRPERLCEDANALAVRRPVCGFPCADGPDACTRTSVRECFHADARVRKPVHGCLTSPCLQKGRITGKTSYFRCRTRPGRTGRHRARAPGAPAAGGASVAPPRGRRAHRGRRAW